MIIPSDKLKHIGVSFLIMVALSVIHIPLLWAALATFTIGLAKELYDKYIQKTFIDVFDLIADIAGIVAGFIWMRLFY
jgi:VanZ family protein